MVSVLQKSILVYATFAHSIVLANTIPASGGTLFSNSNSPAATAISCNGPFMHKAPKGILWSSVATLLICALVAVKPNIGSRGEGTWRQFSRQLGMAFCAVVAPEMMIFWALKQWFGARRIQKEYNDQGWTMVHGHFMQMGGFALFDGEQNKGVLSPERFRELLLSGRITFPTIRENEIKDCSKDTAPIKFFAFFQAVWVIAQFSARVWHGFALTGLELLSLTAVASSLAMLGLWWDKPLGIRTSVPVHLLDGMVDNEKQHTVSEMFDLEATDPSTMEVINSPPSNSEKTHNAPIKPGYMHVPTFHYARSTGTADVVKITPRLSILSNITVTLVGAFYCLSCIPGVLSFPTYTEAILWRVCSTIVIAVIFALFLEVSGFYTFHAGKSGLVRNAVDVYLVARFVLLVVALGALRAMPPTADVVVRWTSYIPHV